MKQKIVSRWDSSKVLFECEVPDDVPSGLAMRHALEKAVASGSNLSGSNLSGSDLRDSNLSCSNLRGSNLSDSNLSGSDLSRSNLSGSNLSCSNLSDSNLSGSDLSRSDLSGSDLSRSDLSRSDLSRSDLRDSDLSRSNLSGSNLSRSNLRGSNLSCSNLRDSHLSGSNLRGSNLSGSDLSRSDLRDIKTDFFEVLLRASTEVAGLRVALVSGKVDGSTYEGECACLVGSIANVRQANYRDLPNELKPNAGRPAERWFLGIKKGDTPETNQISRITVEWLDYFVGLLNIVKAAS